MITYRGDFRSRTRHAFPITARRLFVRHEDFFPVGRFLNLDQKVEQAELDGHWHEPKRCSLSRLGQYLGRHLHRGGLLFVCRLLTEVTVLANCTPGIRADIAKGGMGVGRDCG